VFLYYHKISNPSMRLLVPGKIGEVLVVDVRKRSFTL
jgi:hypothetical protein